MKIFIGIPFLHNTDTLYKCLNSIQSQEHELNVLIVNNGNNEIKIEQDNIQIIKTDNWGVAKSWNHIIKTAYKEKYDLCIVSNFDIIFGPNSIDKMIEESTVKQVLQTREIGLTTFDGFSLFLIKQWLYEKIGDFDEKFQAFYEDFDYTRRIEKNGEDILHEFDDKQIQHLKHQTLKTSNLIEKEKIMQKLNDSKKYYKIKWGNYP